MRIIFIVLALCITASHSLRAQDVPGCMDPLATGYYNPNATISDGSCVYSDGSVALLNSRIATLPEDLREISGMIYWNGKLYGHEDSGNDPIIYEMDAATGVISKRITLEVPVTHMDWEDITQDENYIYVGDFGNNSGTRHDLRIFRVAKSLIAASGSTGTIAAANIGTINFTYKDQADFTSQPNTTPFDCEAMIYHDGNLHLFTKGWDGNGTKHYVLPAIPGLQEATHLETETFNTGAIRITSATKANDNAVILLGYETVGLTPRVAIWIISGFNDYNAIIETGNKRKIDLGLIVNTLTTGIGQAEAITATSQTRVLISSEYFTTTQGPFTITIDQSLFELNTEQWMPLYILPFGIANFTSRLSNNQVVLTWEYSEQGVAYFEVEAAGQANGAYKSIGKVYTNTSSHLFSFTDKEPLVSAQRFYRLKLISPDGKYSYSKTLAVSDSSNTQFNLTVAPNPFNDKLDIGFYSDQRQTVQFSIMDMHGRTVVLKQLQCTPGRYSYMMDGLQGLSSGVYFLTARTPGNNYVRKIVR